MAPLRLWSCDLVLLCLLSLTDQWLKDSSASCAASPRGGLGHQMRCISSPHLCCKASLTCCCASTTHPSVSKPFPESLGPSSISPHSLFHPQAPAMWMQDGHCSLSSLGDIPRCLSKAGPPLLSLLKGPEHTLALPVPPSPIGNSPGGHGVGLGLPLGQKWPGGQRSPVIPSVGFGTAAA